MNQFLAALELPSVDRVFAQPETQAAMVRKVVGMAGLAEAFEGAGVAARTRRMSNESRWSIISSDIVPAYWILPNAPT